jgi:probable HAF family extracellular repeat protein
MREMTKSFLPHLMGKYVVWGGLAALLLTVATASHAAYTIKDLGTLGGSTSYGADLNASGVVVGYSLRTDETWGAFVYSNGSMQDLGSLSGEETYALGINAKGQIVGRSGNRAFLYSGGSMQDLGSLGAHPVFANAINESGQVVGGSAKVSNEFQLRIEAFRYSNGSMQGLGTLGGLISYANDINAAGQVTGESSETEKGGRRAFLYSNGSMQDLGDIGPSEGSRKISYGNAINDSGQVVGAIGPQGYLLRAFLFSNGAMSDLGTLNGASASSADDINNAGTIVGESGDRAFVYSLSGGMADLNSLVVNGEGWVLRRARAVNDAGQIAGYGSLNGADRAFLLTPVPEPSTLALSICGLGLLGALLRRRAVSTA